MIQRTVAGVVLGSWLAEIAPRGWQCGFNVVLPWPSSLSPRFPIPDRKVTQQHPLVAFQPHSFSVSLSLSVSPPYSCSTLFLPIWRLSHPRTCPRHMYVRTHVHIQWGVSFSIPLPLPSTFLETSQSRTHTRRTNANVVLIVYATGTLNGIAEAWLLQFTTAVSESRPGVSFRDGNPFSLRAAYPLIQHFALNLSRHIYLGNKGLLERKEIIFCGANISLGNHHNEIRLHNVAEKSIFRLWAKSTALHLLGHHSLKECYVFDNLIFILSKITKKNRVVFVTIYISWKNFSWKYYFNLLLRLDRICSEPD